MVPIRLRDNRTVRLRKASPSEKGSHVVFDLPCMSPLAGGIVSKEVLWAAVLATPTICLS